MQYCELHFAGREFTAFIHVGLIGALQKAISGASIPPGQSGPGGLLLGRGSEGAAIILSYVPQLGRNFVRDKDQFWKQFASSLDRRTDQLEILGYYRLASGAEPVPDERDLQIMREFLSESASILLLIGTSQGSNAGSLFAWGEKDRQRLIASKTKVQFPKSSGPETAHPREDASQSPDRVEQFKQARTSDRGVLDVEEPGSSQTPSLPAAGNNPISRMPRVAIRIACPSPLVWVLAICIAAIPLWPLISNRQSRPDSFQKSHVQQEWKPLAPAARIENGRLRVTWNTTSPLLLSARSAVLSVNPERGTPDTQVLSRDQLLTGSATFQLPPGHAKIHLLVFSEETSELAPRTDPGMDSQPLTPVAAIPEPDHKATSKEENLPLPKGKVPDHNSRTSVVSPPASMGMKRREEHVNRMTVGFRDESWLDRVGPAGGREVLGFTQISEHSVPPRPIRLVQPDRYYSLYPFTLDSVLIEVRVKINTFGAVTSAEPMSWGNALLNHLSSIAVRAARASTFVPARFGDSNVPSTAVLSYRFLRRK